MGQLETLAKRLLSLDSTASEVFAALCVERVEPTYRVFVNLGFEFDPEALARLAQDLLAHRVRKGTEDAVSEFANDVETLTHDRTLVIFEDPLVAAAFALEVGRGEGDPSSQLSSENRLIACSSRVISFVELILFMEAEKRGKVVPKGLDQDPLIDDEIRTQGSDADALVESQSSEQVVRRRRDNAKTLGERYAARVALIVGGDR
ncbi:MAG: hypothetical protein JJLCMIEE_03419 [Acidimicrobiales bacterium]|nr:hypothetical protein [Acidimicrobiales bacterium]